MSLHQNLFFNNKYKLHQKTSLWFVAYACIVTWLLPYIVWKNSGLKLFNLEKTLKDP